MTDFRQASRLWSGNLGLHLALNPAKTWSFCGSVPAVLRYVTQDGKEPSSKQLSDARNFGPRIAGLKTRVFGTRKDGIAAAEAIGAAICAIPTCACAKDAARENGL